MKHWWRGDTEISYPLVHFLNACTNLGDPGLSPEPGFRQFHLILPLGARGARLLGHHPPPRCISMAFSASRGRAPV